MPTRTREVVLESMRAVFVGLPYGIEHTERVVANVVAILDGELAPAPIRDVAFLAAVLHDIGAAEALRRHGSIEGRHQELEGPAVARDILERAGAPPEVVVRICHIVGHHHTASAVEGLDFEAVWDGDLIEALVFAARDVPAAILELRIDSELRTSSGRKLARARLGLAPARHTTSS
jgi:hypothetical protein